MTWLYVAEARTCAAGEGSVDSASQRLRKLFVEHLPVGRQVVQIVLQVVGHPDRVEPHAEHLGVFGLLERELRQVHLVAEATFGPHGRHERLDVLGDRFLAGDELSAQSGGPVPFEVRHGLPVGPVAGEVDVGGIPELGVAPGEQLQREAVPVEAACGEGFGTCPSHGPTIV